MKIPKKTKAAILTKIKKPLSIEEILLPKQLFYGQVLVKINYSGICGSQIGEIDGIKGKDKFLPHLLGHEGSGTVLKIGEGVSTLEEGDNVVLHWRKGKGLNSLTPVYKLGNKNINAGWVTTFNDYAVVSENRLTRIDKNVDQMTAPLLGCALTTGFGVIENDAKLKIGESIVIFGSGGIGLSMIQAASSKGAHPIIAIDKFAGRLELAKEHGADKTINSTKSKSIVSEINVLTDNKLDIFIDNTGISEVIELGYSIVHKTGRVVLVGVPRHDKQITLNSLPLHFGKSIVGSEGGSSNPSTDIPRYLNLIKENKLNISKQVTQICLLEDINDAISDMKSGKTDGRIIIDLTN